ncbi:MAG: flagellar basal body L-ring protein FlgH [Candidatus Marinimicrobia bacterium]|nr:flagellar basal body L-ring protein FlgH [Candidatus Neomarinimicrobiota bacterium]MCF7880533.1 flagellar basal body L-ring protein FlgH [Candidatus Neomarinimicrobiota bacterium]
MIRKIFPIAVMLLTGVGLLGQSLNSLYTDHKARQPGDLITVLIMEFAEGENQAQTETESEDEAAVSLSQGTGFLGFIPEAGAGGSISNSYSGSGSNSRTGSLSGKITVRIDSIMPGGTYWISGQRIIDVNKEKQIMQLREMVRPRDIQPDNTVYSYLVADAEITYEGRGVVAAGHKPGIIRRILNWLF